MSEIVYRSEVRIERVKGPVRRAYLPAEAEPVIFGVHGAIAWHYNVPAAVAEPKATTLADKCPVYRSLKAAIAMTTELVLEPASA